MAIVLQSTNARAGPGPSSAATKRAKGSQKATTPKSGKRLQHARRAAEDSKFKALQEAARDFVPPLGLEAFADLPISDLTKKGLKKASFIKMTDIQTSSIPVSLKGGDVLGAARTGSGKTLAFLVPVLEALYRNKWGPQDGLGALILSPTRELAMQIFDVLRAIGGFHSFSAGLVIGGKNLKDEAERLARMNILVATPGRLLQHMDQTVGFECDNLQVLVLDEADRILDMGFSKALNAIVNHLPKSRQTLLFSATQTDSVKDLARLSLKSPQIVGVREAEHEAATPKNLAQHYLVCTLDKKLDVLFSFIKTHLQVKVLVFMSSRKQVQFIYETFCKMHPGTSLLALHGTQKQTKRLDIFQRFTTMKSAILFATDIAARGLDFPSVDWVLQLDAPEDAETYIHRVGRTARYESKGQSLLFLLPSEEEGMLKALKAKGVVPEKIKVKESKTLNVQNQLQSFAFQDPEIKYLGQKAFVSYVRSIHLQKDKDTFKVTELPLKEFAAALGLPGAPKVKFVQKAAANNQKNAQRAIAAPAPPSEDEEDDGDEDDDEDTSSNDEEDNAEQDAKAPTANRPVVRTKYDRMFERKNQNILSEHYSKLVDHSTGQDDADILASGDEEDDFISIKRVNHDLPPSLDDVDSEALKAENLSKRKQRALKSKKAITKNSAGLNSKIVFDEEGNAQDAYRMTNDSEFRMGGEEAAREAGRAFAETERARLKDADVFDKQLAKEKKQEKKRKRKERQAAAEGGSGPIAMLDPLSDDDGYVSPTFNLSEHSSDDEDLPPPPSKRRRDDTGGQSNSRPGASSWMDDEERALALLRGR